jgi:hypothetical protein
VPDEAPDVGVARGDFLTDGRHLVEVLLVAEEGVTVQNSNGANERVFLAMHEVGRWRKVELSATTARSNAEYVELVMEGMPSGA